MIKTAGEEGKDGPKYDECRTRQLLLLCDLKIAAAHYGASRREMQAISRALPFGKPHEHCARAQRRRLQRNATASAAGMNSSEATLPIITIDATRSGSCPYFSAKI